MTTYVLIHGGGGSAWDWHLLVPELRARGHDAVAMDLPSEDPSAGLSEYADAVVEVVGERTGLVVVAHSLGGFTAPLVCERVPVDQLVLVAAMVPSPGETGETGGPTRATGRHSASSPTTTAARMPSSTTTSRRSSLPGRANPAKEEGG